MMFKAPVDRLWFELLAYLCVAIGYFEIKLKII